MRTNLAFASMGVTCLAGLPFVASIGMPSSKSVRAPTAASQEETVVTPTDVAKQIADLQSRLDALRSQQAAQELSEEGSVRPGINDSWKSDNIQPLIQRLENESREIFTQCDTIAALVGLLPGMDVADIGAGSGFMAQIFTQLVGDDGTVVAVDINAALMERLTTAAQVEGIENLQTVVCSERSVDLPPDSVDLVFVCDTYHHFEYPRSTLSSIHRALRPGGQLVVVDFHRIPGVSRDWVLEHVRAGEEVVTQEIVDAGFVQTNRHYLPQLTENYVLRFRKP